MPNWDHLSRGCIVTGTDTGVGKTWVTGSLAYLLRQNGFQVAVHKPVQSGVSELQSDETDSWLLKHMSEVPDDERTICPISLQEPLAPVMAARREGLRLDSAQMLDTVKRMASSGRFLLVEGAGGLVVPLAESMDLSTVGLALNLPILIVARTGLGTVNHTVLTAEVAKARGLTISGIVLNGARSNHDPMIMENIEMIEQLSGVQVLAVTPHAQDPWQFRERFMQVWKQPYPWYEMEDFK